MKRSEAIRLIVTALEPFKAELLLDDLLVIAHDLLRQIPPAGAPGMDLRNEVVASADQVVLAIQRQNVANPAGLLRFVFRQRITGQGQQPRGGPIDAAALLRDAEESERVSTPERRRRPSLEEVRAHARKIGEALARMPPPPDFYADPDPKRGAA